MFDPGGPFQPSLKFAGKASNLHKSRAPKGRLSGWHFSLLGSFVSYNLKSFIILVPGAEDFVGDSKVIHLQPRVFLQIARQSWRLATSPSMWSKRPSHSPSTQQMGSGGMQPGVDVISYLRV